MTSVLSLQRQSSGSKILGILLLSYILTSCGSFNQMSRDNNAEILKPDPIEDKDPMDPKLEDKEISDPLIEEEMDERNIAFFGEDNPVIRMVVCGPFSDLTRSRFIEFYSGAKFAAREKMLDIDIQVVAMDISGGVAPLDEIKLSAADVVIGPYYPKDIEQVMALLDTSKNRLFVSPWLSNRYIPNGVNYVQLPASLESHFERILGHSLRKWNPQEILVVTKEGESELHAIIDSLARDLLDDRDLSLKRYEIEEVNSRSVIDSLRSSFFTHGIKAIIVPHWKDLTFLRTFLGRVNVAQGEEPPAIYCLQQLLQGSDLDYTMLENLNIYITSTKRDDFQSKEAIVFRKNYFSEYFQSPNKEVYFGYDTFILSLELVDILRKHNSLPPQYECLGCFNGITVESQKQITGGPRPSYPLVEASNKRVDLVEFRKYEFVEVLD